MATEGGADTQFVNASAETPELINSTVESASTALVTETQLSKSKEPDLKQPAKQAPKGNSNSRSSSSSQAARPPWPAPFFQLPSSDQPKKRQFGKQVKTDRKLDESSAGDIRADVEAEFSGPYSSGQDATQASASSDCEGDLGDDEPCPSTAVPTKLDMAVMLQSSVIDSGQVCETGDERIYTAPATLQRDVDDVPNVIKLGTHSDITQVDVHSHGTRAPTEMEGVVDEDEDAEFPFVAEDEPCAPSEDVEGYVAESMGTGKAFDMWPVDDAYVVKSSLGANVAESPGTDQHVDGEAVSQDEAKSLANQCLDPLAAFRKTDVPCTENLKTSEMQCQDKAEIDNATLGNVEITSSVLRSGLNNSETDSAIVGPRSCNVTAEFGTSEASFEANVVVKPQTSLESDPLGLDTVDREKPYSGADSAVVESRSSYAAADFDKLQLTLETKDAVEQASLASEPSELDPVGRDKPSAEGEFVVIGSRNCDAAVDFGRSEMTFETNAAAKPQQSSENDPLEIGPAVRETIYPTAALDNHGILHPSIDQRTPQRIDAHWHGFSDNRQSRQAALDDTDMLCEPNAQGTHQPGASHLHGFPEKLLQTHQETVQASDSLYQQLEETLRIRKEALAQLRLDYQARVDRSTQLESAVASRRLRLDTCMANTGAEIAACHIEMQKHQATASTKAMANEDLVSHGVRQIAARDEDIRLLEHRVHQQQQIYQRLLQSRDSVSANVVKEVLQARAKQIDALKNELSSHQQHLELLCTDLRRILDFMMRVNIEAAGGPSNHLNKDHFLPPNARQALFLSEHGMECYTQLVCKYEACMAECRHSAAASGSAANEYAQTGDGIPHEVANDGEDLLRDFSEGIRSPENSCKAVPLPAPAHNAESRSSSVRTISVASTREAPLADRTHKPYRCIQALGSRKPQAKGLLSSAAKLLRAPVRDGVGFLRQRRAETVKRLTSTERDLGVWSDWVTNYTHAGLVAALETSRSASGPIRSSGNKQAFVLSSERIFMLDASTWELKVEIDLEAMQAVHVSSFSSTILILRAQRRSDIIIDLESRDRLLDELVLAVRRSGRNTHEALHPSDAARSWEAASDVATGYGRSPMQVLADAEPLVALLDEKQARTATVAYVEQNVFLLLPYIQASLLHAGPETLFIGFLQMQVGSGSGVAGASGGWHLFFFLLKGGASRAERELAWCHHPCDTKAAGTLTLSTITRVHPADVQDGSHCLVVERANTAAPLLTLRAASRKSREDWLKALQVVCG